VEKTLQSKKVQTTAGEEEITVLEKERCEKQNKY